MNKIANFESDLLKKRTKIELPKFAWAPPYKRLNFSNFAELLISSLA